MIPKSFQPLTKTSYEDKIDITPDEDKKKKKKKEGIKILGLADFLSKQDTGYEKIGGTLGYVLGSALRKNKKGE